LHRTSGVQAARIASVNVVTLRIAPNRPLSLVILLPGARMDNRFAWEIMPLTLDPNLMAGYGYAVGPEPGNPVVFPGSIV
jgi:hypothetical protein